MCPFYQPSLRTDTGGSEVRACWQDDGVTENLTIDDTATRWSSPDRGGMPLLVLLLGSPVLLGLALAFHLGAWGEGWFSAKLALVVALTGYQGWMGAYGRKLANGARPLENRTLRIMNEVPGIMTAIIVVLVIVKPF